MSYQSDRPLFLLDVGAPERCRVRQNPVVNLPRTLGVPTVLGLGIGAAARRKNHIVEFGIATGVAAAATCGPEKLR